jgi:hypothetical protein
VLAVQESAILRFVSKLASGGVNAYVEGADRELNLAFAAMFGALRDDTRAVFTSMETQTPSR